MCNMRLAQIRKAKGLSLEALGEMIGKDPATVHRAEKMHHTAKLATYQACADALGVTLQDIFCESVSPIEADLLAAFRQFPETERGVFFGLIETAKARARSSDPEGNQAHGV